MSIAFRPTPAREAAWAAMHQANLVEADAEAALAQALDYLATHRRPDVYARVEHARAALRTARRAARLADARWIRA